MAYTRVNWENKPSINTPINEDNLNNMDAKIKDLDENKQDILESGTNIKTINGQSILGSGNIEIQGGGAGEGDTVGTIKLWGGTNAPDGWHLCDGSAISRTDYAELFAIYGTTYGSGDGSTTFNLPDIKDRVVVGLDENDTDFNVLGKKLGEKTHTLTKSELPQIDIQTNFASSSGGNGSGLVFGTKIGNSNNNLVSNVNFGSQPHNIIQPTIVLNYIVKISRTTTLPAQVVDSLDSDSTVNAPSVRATKDGINTALQGTTLYNNASGSNTTISLNDSILNYDMLEIFYRSSDNVWGSVRCINPQNNKKLEINSSLIAGDIYFKTANYHLYDASIVYENGREYSIGLSGAGNWGIADAIYITKVVGYKF